MYEYDVPPLRSGTLQVKAHRHLGLFSLALSGMAMKKAKKGLQRVSSRSTYRNKTLSSLRLVLTCNCDGLAPRANDRGCLRRRLGDVPNPVAPRKTTKEYALYKLLNSVQLTPILLRAGKSPGHDSNGCGRKII